MNFDIWIETFGGLWYIDVFGHDRIYSNNHVIGEMSGFPKNFPKVVYEF